MGREQGELTVERNRLQRVNWAGEVGQREPQEGRDIYIHVADSVVVQ